MSLLGFNFSFGARDDGFASALTRAGAGIKGVSHQVDSLADKVSTGNFFNALNTLQLDRIGDQLSQLSGKGQQLETSLEGTFRNMSAEIRPTLAQMGLTNAEFSKATSQITSTADALNVGAGEVANSFRAIRRAGQPTQDVLKDMKIGMKELTLITKATGMETEQFTAFVRNLTESYGFSTDGASSFLDGFTNLTQGLGIADVAFGSLQETMSTLDDTLSSNTQFMAMSKDEQAKHVEEQVMGVQRLTKAFMGLGKSPQEAQASALQFFKTLSTERKSVNGMTIGIGDMGETFKSLAEEAGFENVDALFGNISADPTTALQQIVGMQEELAKAGDPAKLARFNSKLQEMMGGLSFMKDAGKGFVARLKEVNGVTGETGDGLVAMAKKAHTTNRGLDEVLQRMEDRFERNLMKLTGNTRTKFVQRQKEMYRVVGEEAKKLAGNETWGPLFKQFVSARKIGASAFFMPMERDSKQLAKTIGNIDSAVGKGGILGRFEAIKTLGIQGFFIDLNKEFATTEDRLKDAEDKAGKYFARLEAIGLTTESLKPALIALGSAFAGLFVAVKTVSMITPIISAIGTLLPMLGAVAGGIASVVATIVASPVVIGVAIAGAIYAIGKGIQYLSTAPQEFFDKIAGFIDKGSDFMRDIFISIMDVDVVSITNDLIDMLVGFFADSYSALAKFISTPSKYMPVIKSILGFVGNLALVLGSALLKLGQVINTIAGRVFDGMLSAFSFVGKKFKEYIYDPLDREIFTPIGEFFGKVFDMMIYPFKAISEWWKGFSIADKFRQFIVAPLASVMDFFANMIYDFVNFAVLGPVEKIVNKLGDIIKFFYAKMPSFVTSRLDKMGLGEIGRKGFEADFQIKRDSETGFLDMVMADAEDKPKTVEVTVQQDAVLRENRKQTEILGQVAETLKRQNGGGGTPQTQARFNATPLAVR